MSTVQSQFCNYIESKFTELKGKIEITLNQNLINKTNRKICLLIIKEFKDKKKEQKKKRFF